MSRELKRVAMDFDWPTGKVWKGFINSAMRETKKCEHCDGGYTPEAAKLKDQWYGFVEFKPEDRGSKPFTPSDPVIQALAQRNIERSPDHYGKFNDLAMAYETQRLCDHFNCGWSHHLNEDDVVVLLKEDRLRDLTHAFTPGEGWVPKHPAVIPTPAEVNAWSLGGMGHDSTNQYLCVLAECERLGISLTCAHCDGDGKTWLSDQAKARAEAWEETPPPVGEGYQMWETVSEGSPISPVFETARELAQWLASNRKGTVDEDTTVSQWLAMIEGPGWVPSMVCINGAVVTGSQMANID